MQGDPGTESVRSPRGRPEFVSLRSALIIIAAVVIGTAAGILAYMAGNKPADAVLTGGAAFAGTIVLLDALIGD
jgi:hypothetical protein